MTLPASLAKETAVISGATIIGLLSGPDAADVIIGAFVENADPNLDCPRCNGEGVGETFFADVRDLQGHALQYFAEVKESKFGIEILTEDKKAARAQLLHLLTFRRTEKLQQLEIERRQLEIDQLRKELNQAGKREGLEGDYQLQALTPDEPYAGQSNPLTVPYS